MRQPERTGRGIEPVNAQWHADRRARRARRARRPKVANLAQNDKLRDYVQDRLAGKIAKPSGELVTGPEVPWIGRRHAVEIIGVPQRARVGPK